MASGQPWLIVVCDGLEAPPRLGHHVHLLSLARAAAEAGVPTRTFCWVPSMSDPSWRVWDRPVAGRPVSGDDGGGHLVPFELSRASPRRPLRKLDYVRRVAREIDAAAPAGSVHYREDQSTIQTNKQTDAFRFAHDFEPVHGALPR